MRLRPRAWAPQRHNASTTCMARHLGQRDVALAAPAVVQVPLLCLREARLPRGAPAGVARCLLAGAAMRHAADVFPCAARARRIRFPARSQRRGGGGGRTARRSPVCAARGHTASVLAPCACTGGRAGGRSGRETRWRGCVGAAHAAPPRPASAPATAMLPAPALAISTRMKKVSDGEKYCSSNQTRH